MMTDLVVSHAIARTDVLKPDVSVSEQAGHKKGIHRGVERSSSERRNRQGHHGSRDEPVCQYIPPLGNVPLERPVIAAVRRSWVRHHGRIVDRPCNLLYDLSARSSPCMTYEAEEAEAALTASRGTVT